MADNDLWYTYLTNHCLPHLRKAQLMRNNKKRKDSNGRILKKGETQRADLSYMYRWTDRSGTRQCIYDTTLEGLRKQEDQIQEEILCGVQRELVTLNQLIERYLKIRVSLAASTYENYMYYYEYSIKESFLGKMKVIDIRKSDVLVFFSSKVIEDGFSNGTIRILHKIIHPALQLAVDDNIIRKNPSSGCMKDYYDEPEKKYALTYEEETEFFERLKSSTRMKRFYPMYAIMLASGLRISETIGLTWKDVDFQSRTISVNHQLQYRKINGKCTWYCEDMRKKKASTKTASGNRVLPMTDELYSLFILQRKEWMNCKKDSDFEVDGYKDFVFLSHVTGKPIYPANVRRMLDTLEKKNKDRDIQLPNISPHIFRHTTATRLAEAGVDIKTIQYLLGQKDLKVTIRVYNHTNLDRARRELEKYTNLFKTQTANPLNLLEESNIFSTPISTPIDTDFTQTYKGLCGI